MSSNIITTMQPPPPPPPNVNGNNNNNNNNLPLGYEVYNGMNHPSLILSHSLNNIAAIVLLGFISIYLTLSLYVSIYLSDTLSEFLSKNSFKHQHWSQLPIVNQNIKQSVHMFLSWCFGWWFWYLMIIIRHANTFAVILLILGAMTVLYDLIYR